jgi:hypothetical protein
MAATKTFETAFKIGAKFTGQPAFTAANRAIDTTERSSCVKLRHGGRIARAGEDIPEAELRSRSLVGHHRF